MHCTTCAVTGYHCLFTAESKAAKKPVCLKCAGVAKLEQTAEIKALQKQQGKVLEKS